MICRPFEKASLLVVTQKFGENPQWYSGTPHTGIDWVSPTTGYGTPLIAPADGIVETVFTPGKLSPSTEPLARGFGIKIRGYDGLAHLYWHCLPVFPVKEGDEVKQGKTIVGFMGNSGYVMTGGKIVPLDLRSVPPYLGTHLHQEVRRPDGSLIDPLSIMDFNLLTVPTALDLLTSIQVTVNKIQFLITGKAV